MYCALDKAPPFVNRTHLLNPLFGGAVGEDRTPDLVLTKDALYH